MKYSEMCTGPIIHVVGGAMNQDLAENIGHIADWFIENDVTLLWGDDYDERNNQNHPVAALEQAIRERKGNRPIRCLLLGEQNFNATDFSDRTQFEPVYDDSNTLIGYQDLSDTKYTAIYSAKQQDRQKAYYNNSYALMALNGGLGVGYEIPTAFLYTLTHDVMDGFKVYIIDDPETEKFKASVDSYLANGGATRADFPQIRYFGSAEEFVDVKKFGMPDPNDNASKQK